MNDSIPHCKEIKGSFAGVKLPKSVRFFDCRSGDDKFDAYKTPYGETLWGSERAAYVMGLRTSWEERYDTRPLNCSVYIDFRSCDEKWLADAVRKMRKEIAYMLREYRKAEKNPAPKGRGGSIVHYPEALALSNFGWCIICDERKYLVVR